MACEAACYEANINECTDIKVKAGLPASTPLYVIIRKPWTERIYQRFLITDADGILTIAQDAFPPGLFVKGNYYRLELRDNTYLGTQIMTFNNVQYRCCMFTVVSFDTAEGDDSPISTIQ